MRRSGNGDSAFVRVHVTFDADGPVAGESLWARHLGGDRYRIANIPFFVEDFGLDDVVRAVDGEVVGVIRRTGHVTVDIVFGEITDSARNRIVSALREHGGRVERATGPVFAADLPGDAEAAFSLLDAEQEGGSLQWELRTRR